MIKKSLEKGFIYLLAFIMGLIAGFCIAYEMLYNKFNDKQIKIQQEINKIASK